MEKDFPRPVRWIGSSYDDWLAFPDSVQDVMGYSLHLAQSGNKADNVKPLKGFRSATVMEIREDYAGNTWRAVNTVQFADVIYVLHAFQKKSKKGIATPKQNIQLIKQRLKLAKQHYETNKT